ncbi:MAG TPA: amidohydrolase, partial [Clostridiales bacterium]|nr:amidohydrolase [Clostridiales bacterium]
MKVKVAAIQFAPGFKKYEENLKKIEDLLKEAYEKETQLAVLPEMCTTGYIFDNRDDIRDFVETVPGRTTDRLCEFAQQFNMHIVIGLAEKDEDDIFYNTAALIGPEGYIGKYRKIHQFIADPLWSADGDLGLEVFDTKIGKIGICICFDMNVEETCAVLDRKGCEVFCAPSNWFGEKPMSPVWITRAFEFGKPIVVSNRTGKERKTVFDGISCIIDKHGNVLDATDVEEGMALAEIDVVEVTPRVKKEFYKDLSRHTYGWNPNWFFRQTNKKL